MLTSQRKRKERCPKLARSYQTERKLQRMFRFVLVDIHMTCRHFLWQDKPLFSSSLISRNMTTSNSFIVEQSSWCFWGTIRCTPSNFEHFWGHTAGATMVLKMALNKQHCMQVTSHLVLGCILAVWGTFTHMQPLILYIICSFLCSGVYVLLVHCINSFIFRLDGSGLYCKCSHFLV